MTSPHATPRYLGVPNTTPSSTGALRKIPRAPINNPYDQFTKPDFDAFIHDITSQLKRALGREESEGVLRTRATQEHTDTDTSEEHDEDEFMEDSFAEVKARRLAKGKQRALEPDEEDEEALVRGVASAEEQHHEQEEVDEEDEDEEDGDSIFDEQWGGPEEGVEYNDDDEEEEEDHVGEDADSVASPPHHEEVIELSSDDDEEPHNVAEQAVAAREHPTQYDLKPQMYSNYDEEDDELVDEEEEQSDEDPDSFPPPTRAIQPVDINDPWTGVATYAEDFYTGGDFHSSRTANAHVLPPEADDEVELIDVDGEGEDAEEESRPVELPDAWAAPRRYMEDFYSGGNVRELQRESDATPFSALADIREQHRDFTSHERTGSSEIPAADDAGVTGPADSYTIPSAEQDWVASDAEVVGISEDLRANGHSYHEEDRDGRLSRMETRTDLYREDASRTPPRILPLTRDVSPQAALLSRHVDWNWPPAFNSGRLATRTGHLMTPEHHIASHKSEIIDIDEDDPSVESYSAEDADEDEVLRYPSKPSSPDNEAPLGRQNRDEDVLRAQLYSDFDSIYMPIDQNGALADEAAVDELDAETSFEPVNGDDTDFGDLPVVTPALSDKSLPVEDSVMPSTMSEEHPVADILELLVAPTTETANEQPSVIREEEATEADASEVENVAVMAASSSQGAPTTQSETEEGQPSFLVEEPMSEGRQTEEPEARERAASFEIIDGLPSTEFSQINREYVIEEVVTEGYGTPVPIDTDADHDPHQANAQRIDDGGFDSTKEVTVEFPSSTSPYPMPVSADPTVPDPTSVSHTPTSPPSPPIVTLTLPSSSPAISNRALSPAMEAAIHLLPDMTYTSLKGSIRGLFTPFTDGTPSPASPIAPDEASSQDSPLADEEVAAVPPEDSAASIASTSAEDTSRLDSDMQISAIDDAVEPLSQAGDQADIHMETTPLTELEDVTSDLAAAGEISTHEEQPKDSPVTELPPRIDISVNEEYQTDNVDAEDATSGQLSHPEVPAPLEDPEVGVDAIDKPTVDEMPDLSVSGTDDVPDQAEDAGLAESTSVTTIVPSTVTHEEVAQMQEAEIAGDELKRPGSSQASTLEPIVTAVAPEDDVFTSPPVSGDWRLAKRKRDLLASATSRVTRSMSGKHEEGVRPPSSTESIASSPSRKRKGKGRAEERYEDENSGEIASVSSGASIASRMLQPPSRSTSRASSVVSDERDASTSRQPSPSLPTKFDFTSARNLPLPITHAHGVMRHRHVRPVSAAQTLRPVPRREMSPYIPPPAASVDQTIIEHDSPPPSTPLPTSTSSPVTRSNCRFHKISIPQEDGPRIYFVVPGCSLSNRELMEEEEIEDHGYATIRDQSSLVADVEALNLGPDSIGVLRQLVGVDLLREQEAFFLPQPGQKYLSESQRKSKVGRQRAPNRESLSMRGLRSIGSSGPSEAVRVSSRQSVSSQGDSASVSSALGHFSERGSITTTASISRSDLSDIEDEEPVTKKTKSNHVDTSENEPDAGTSTHRASTVSNRRKPRRSKRLGKDASAHEPGPDNSEDDGETQEAVKRTTKNRGTKRNRQEESIDDQDDNHIVSRKKRRTRSSVGRGSQKTRINAQDTR